MDTLFNIATSISTPLMLAGFLSAAFFLILREILKRDLFPKLSRALSSEIIKLIIDRLFILTLVALLLGFTGFVAVPLGLLLPLPVPPIDNASPPEATLSYRCYVNLLECSTPIPIYIPNQSTSKISSLDESGLAIEFANQHNGSGVAFQFKPRLDLNNYSLLELKGVSNNAFQFRIEYKKQIGDILQIIGVSPPHEFPETSVSRTISVPLTTNARIDEIAINFQRIGDRADIMLNYLRLR